MDDGTNNGTKPNEGEGICQNLNLEISDFALDTLEGHGRIATFKAFLDSLNNEEFVENHKEIKERLVGEGKYAAPFNEIYASYLKNYAFRKLNPCEFAGILKNAASTEDVYTYLAIKKNPEGKSVLDIVYKVKTNQRTSKFVDSSGYFFVDDSCPCSVPCCCSTISPCPQNGPCLTCPRDPNCLPLCPGAPAG